MSANRLISPSEVAREFIESVDAASKHLSEPDKAEFMKELVEWLYQLNGFPPSGPKDH